MNGIFRGYTSISSASAYASLLLALLGAPNENDEENQRREDAAIHNSTGRCNTVPVLAYAPSTFFSEKARRFFLSANILHIADSACLSNILRNFPGCSCCDVLAVNPARAHTCMTRYLVVLYQPRVCS